MSNLTYTLTEKLLWNLYITDIKKYSFEHVEEVPNLDGEILPVLIGFIILEHFISKLMGKGGTKISDGIASISNGIFLEMATLLLRGVELYGYQWLYRYRIIEFDWKSSITWWSAALAVDFVYYWFHRLGHEVNILWSSHQVHHSSEEYNITTALRMPALQRTLRFGLYQPFALLGIPLAAVLMHIYFNQIAQAWIHTEVIGNLGPLEWILNTPSHHRIHHGINKWCLDKNYGGWLIIWDRMFGTFQANREDDPIVYGLVSQPQTFNPVTQQLFYYKDTFQKALSMDTWVNSFKALFYGPAWTPGGSRLGDISDLPDKTPPRKKYASKLNGWGLTYVCIHFFMVVVFSQIVAERFETYNNTTAFVSLSFIALSFFTFGLFLDSKTWAPFLEMCRCLLAAAAIKSGLFFGDVITGHNLIDSTVPVCFLMSALLWFYKYVDATFGKSLDKMAKN